jgi:hypothetical protein
MRVLLTRLRLVACGLLLYSHSIVSEGRKPSWNPAFVVMTIALYRYFYRLKTSVFAGAEDGLGLTGGYSRASIVNYRHERPRHFF